MQSLFFVSGIHLLFFHPTWGSLYAQGLSLPQFPPITLSCVLTLLEKQRKPWPRRWRSVSLVNQWRMGRAEWNWGNEDKRMTLVVLHRFSKTCSAALEAAVSTHTLTHTSDQVMQCVKPTIIAHLLDCKNTNSGTLSSFWVLFAGYCSRALIEDSIQNGGESSRQDTKQWRKIDWGLTEDWSVTEETHVNGCVSL